MTLDRYIEKKEYLENCLNELQENIENHKKWLNKQKSLGLDKDNDSFKNSLEFENKFTSLVKTKKKLADMINDINSELELMTLY